MSTKEFFIEGDRSKPDPAAVTPPTKNRRLPLTGTASLTFVSNLLQQGARLGVALAIAPIVIRVLGAELYGAWVMIQQTVGYLALGDLRPMGALKLTLAVGQHRDDVQEKRRLIGAALVGWLISAPVLLALGIAAIWLAPTVIRVRPEHVADLRLAMGISALGLLLEGLWSLPGNVLRGVNLEYRAMGAQGLVVVLAGVGGMVAVLAGWALPGLAGATLLGAAAGASLRWHVMQRAVPWFGVARPGRSELKQALSLGVWSLGGALAWVVLTASDFLLVGMVLSPAAAAAYATTGAVLRLGTEPLAQLVSSGNAGIHGLAGAGETRRLSILREEMYIAAVAGLGVVGAGVAALNGGFLRLWVGEGFYAGDVANIAMVGVVLLGLLLRVDTAFTDSVLALRERVAAMFFCGAFSLAVAALLGRSLGLSGIAIGVFLGRLPLALYMPWLVQRRAGLRIVSPWPLARCIGAASLLVGGAALAGQVVRPASWIALVGSGFVVGTVSCAAMYFMGLTPQFRAALTARVRGLLPRT
jgi:O-antigen/teichoic acid export membrane protein